MKRLAIHHRFRQVALLVIGVLPFAATTPTSAQQISTQQVRFAKGNDKATMKGSLDGRSQYVRDYIVSIKQGQTLAVELVTKSADTHFNVMAPDSIEVPFVGEMEGRKSWQASLNRSGNYTIRVHLTRDAANRGALSSYTLNVAVR